MFFYIGKTSPLQSLTKTHNELYLDHGWTSETVNSIPVWYKGYSTDCRLSDSLNAIIEGYQPRGKWALIYFKDDKYTICHPELRGFPLYTNGTDYANVKFDNVKNVKYNKPKLNVTVDNLSIEDASTIIGDILLENIADFYKYNDVPRMNVISSAGLDTSTTWAVFDSFNKDYLLKAHVPNSTDATFYDRMGRIRTYESDLVDKVSNDYWGYEISSFYQDISWVITGFYAEVIQYRDGEAINALANYKGLWIDELCGENDYLYWFLKRENVLARYKNEKLVFANEDELRAYLFDTIFRDYQMWHIDNNMMFSPFADIRITETVHRMSLDDIIENSRNGTIQRNIIKRFKPELLGLVSDFKNEKGVWNNFKQNFDAIPFDQKTTVLLV